MKSAVRVLAIASVTVLAAMTTSVSGLTLPPDVVVDATDLKEGDVVAEGVEAGTDACLIGSVEVIIEATNDGQWIGLGLDSECRLIVDKLWEGPVESALGPEVDGAVPFKSLAINDVATMGDGLSALSACKTATQEIRHSGWGGDGDLITRTTGSISFCYTGSVIYNASYAPYGCWAKGNVGWYDWVIDACYTITWTNTSTYVEHYGAGDYHCHQNPMGPPCNISTPDGYYHTLRAKEYAYPSGSAYCSGNYSGVVVRTPRQVIIQGCSAA